MDLGLTRNSLLTLLFTIFSKPLFQSDSFTLDFQSKTKEAVDEINGWGDKATKRLIKKFLEYNENRKQTALILANALYFKAAWWDQFDEKETGSGSFYTFNGDILQVAFMCKQYDDNCLYASSKGFEVLRLPYSDYPLESSFSMYIFLSDEKDGLLNLLDQFSSNPSDLFNPQFEFEHVQIRELMTKFKFKSKLQRFEEHGVIGVDDDFGRL